MTNRLNILKNSLEKKKKVLDQRFKTHFDDVKSGNGQPMNDKRNGAATFKRWDKQEEAIRSQKKEIEKTKNAIEREESKIKHCEAVNKEIPEPILKLVGSGELAQWRKFPNRFFVTGVKSGRIIWDIKKQKLLCSHIAEIPDDQYAKFRDIFNNLKKELTNLN